VFPQPAPARHTGTVMAIFAHQGGWDELLLVAAPVAVIALLLVLADKRAKRALDASEADRPDGGDGPAA
jgi:hypothetical protein